MVLSRGGRSAAWVEIGAMIVGLFLAGLGLWHRSEWLALGFALHGGWDLLHHRSGQVVGVRDVPVWYIPFCVVYDLVVAAAVLVVL